MDTARGAAALLVLIGHSSNIFLPSVMGEVDSTGIERTGAVPTPGGHVASRDTATLPAQAVVVFFVLSGFLVGGSVIRALKRGSWSWADYLTKRLTRLWIVLLPALVLGVTLDLLGSHIFPRTESLYWHTTVPCFFPAPVMARISPINFLGNAVFIQVIVVRSLGTNTALWSLTNEFWYYVAFPLLLIPLWRGTKLAIRLVYAALATGLLIFLGWEIAIRLPIWIIGALAAAIPPRLPHRIASIGAGIFSLLLLPLMALLRETSLTLIQSYWILAVFFAMLIYFWTHLNRPSRSRFYGRFSQLLSDLSYPVYLVHLPILAFLAAWTDTPFHKWPRTPGTLTVLLAFDLIAIAVAYALHLAFQARTTMLRHWIFEHLKKGKHRDEGELNKPGRIAPELPTTPSMR